VISGKSKTSQRADIPTTAARPSRFKKLLLNVAGFTALALGTLGIFLPLLPTTPFVLLAVICFSTANPGMAARLRKSRLFGGYLENWYMGTGVSRAYKIKVILFLWAGIGSSIYIVQPVWLMALLGLIGVCVTVHILSLKTKRPPA